MLGWIFYAACVAVAVVLAVLAVGESRYRELVPPDTTDDQ